MWMRTRGTVNLQKSKGGSNPSVSLGLGHPKGDSLVLLFCLPFGTCFAHRQMGVALDSPTRRARCAFLSIS